MAGKSKQDLRCSCGEVVFEMTGAPLFRMLCHCSICRRFNDADFADVTVFSAQDIDPPPLEAVRFQTYKPPPNVQRGKCASCEQPAIELFQAPLFPKMVMVPRGMFSDDSALPQPCGHLFYEGRVADVADSLPKHTGFVRSQLVFFKHFAAAKLFGSKRR